VIDPATTWTMIVVMGIGTWLIRFSFLALIGRAGPIPPIVGRILRLIPAAVLTALVVPGVAYSGGSFDLGTARFLAALVAAGVAWRTRNVTATIAVGMAILWIATALS
jgi:branched-subunit amino acid transport protein